MDICIYTTKETLEHKKGNHYEGYYWAFNRFPKKYKEDDRVYFAIEGNIIGYFHSTFIDEEYDNHICWKGKDWVELKKPIPQKSFQGFKYVAFQKAP